MEHAKRLEPFSAPQLRTIKVQRTPFTCRQFIWDNIPTVHAAKHAAYTQSTNSAAAGTEVIAADQCKICSY
jgi:hypothetical protein